MANPAMVAISRATGTTITTMRLLDLSNVVMLATSNASAKLPHCGSLGHSKPVGSDPDGCSAVVRMLRNGKTVNAIIASRKARPPNSSPRDVFTRFPAGSGVEWAG